jgi:hypothetical protein
MLTKSAEINQTRREAKRVDTDLGGAAIVAVDFIRALRFPDAVPSSRARSMRLAVIPFVYLVGAAFVTFAVTGEATAQDQPAPEAEGEEAQPVPAPAPPAEAQPHTNDGQHEDADFLAWYAPAPVEAPALRLPEPITRLYLDASYVRSDDLSALPFIEG